MKKKNRSDCPGSVYNGHLVVPLQCKDVVKDAITAIVYLTIAVEYYTMVVREK
jgi:hypothetical protein